LTSQFINIYFVTKKRSRKLSILITLLNKKLTQSWKEWNKNWSASIAWAVVAQSVQWLAYGLEDRGFIPGWGR